jgi:hypothetical protein
MPARVNDAERQLCAAEARAAAAEAAHAEDVRALEVVVASLQSRVRALEAQLAVEGERGGGTAEEDVDAAAGSGSTGAVAPSAEALAGQHATREAVRASVSTPLKPLRSQRHPF